MYLKINTLCLNSSATNTNSIYLLSMVKFEPPSQADFHTLNKFHFSNILFHSFLSTQFPIMCHFCLSHQRHAWWLSETGICMTTKLFCLFFWVSTSGSLLGEFVACSLEGVSASLHVLPRNLQHPEIIFYAVAFVPRAEQFCCKFSLLWGLCMSFHTTV